MNTLKPRTTTVNDKLECVTHSVQMPSPLGPMRIDADDRALKNGAIVGIYFEGQRWEPASVSQASIKKIAVIEQAIEQLNEFFSGNRAKFNLPLQPIGTNFQQQVWQQIASIGCADSLSYGVIAQRIDRPKASRAVGAATGRNPISIVIPCHRVLGASGALTGYAGGLERKVWLLAHENKFKQPQLL